MDRRNKRIFDKDFKIQTAKQRIGKNVIMNIVMMSFSILYASKIEYLYTNIILKHIKTGKSYRSDGNNFLSDHNLIPARKGDSNLFRS